MKRFKELVTLLPLWRDLRGWLHPNSSLSSYTLKGGEAQGEGTSSKRAKEESPDEESKNPWAEEESYLVRVRF